jgi:hypothetical protein
MKIKKLFQTKNLMELFNLAPGQTLNLYTLLNEITHHVVGKYHL